MDSKTRIVEFSEIAVWSGMWRAVAREHALAFGLEMKSFGSATAYVFKQLPDWFFNRVIGFGLDEIANEALLDKIIGLYQDNNLPVGISLSPKARPGVISDWLERRGFKLQNNWVKMIRGTDSPPDIHCNYDFRKAGKPDAKIAGELIKTGFGLPEKFNAFFAGAVNNPNNHVYLAMDSDTPVAIGILTIDGDVGHLNTAATLQDYRNQGIQGAIMAHRIREGIQLGCKWFVSETGLLPDRPNPSYNNMLRCGFNLHYTRPNFVLSC